MSRVVTDVDLSTGRIDYGEGGGGGGATVNVGDTTTLPAGSNATVTNSGTETDVVLDFGIPRGADGATGADGDDGITPTVAVTAITGGHNVAFSYGSGDTRNTDFDVMDGADGQQGQQGQQGPAGADASMLVIENSFVEITRAADGTLLPQSIGFLSYIISGDTKTRIKKDWQISRSDDGTNWTQITTFSDSSNVVIGSSTLLSTTRFLRADIGVTENSVWTRQLTRIVPVINDGAKGADGGGVPVGGTAGQFLVKNSATDYDAEWLSSLPTFSTANRVSFTPSITPCLIVDTSDRSLWHHNGTNMRKVNHTATTWAQLAAAYTWNDLKGV